MNMKNLVIALLLVCSVSAFAQSHKKDRKDSDGDRKEMRTKMSDLTPEQMAELSTKKLTLHLDLTAQQQVAVHKLELAKATKRKEHAENRKDRKERKELSDTERFEMKTKRLDEQIANKREMKSILTEAQYEKWEKAHKQKNRKRNSDRKKR